MNCSGGQTFGGLIFLLVFATVFLLLILIGVPFRVALIAVTACVILATAFINTDVALIILIFSMLLSPEMRTGGGIGGGRQVVIRADDIFIILIFVGWMAKMAINKELGLLRSSSLNMPILSYALICVTATFLGILAGNQKMKASFFYVLKYIEYFLIYFMVSNHLKNLRQARQLIFFILLTCFLVCVYAAVSGPIDGRMSAPFEGPGGEPNTFAGYLVLMMSLMIGMLIYPVSGRQRIALFGLLGLSAVVFLLTLSRSGWLAFIPAFLTFIFLNRQHRIILIAVLMLGVIILPLVAPKEVQNRINETFVPWKTYRVMGARVGVDESAAARIDSWGVGVKAWVKRPILGYGVPAGTVVDNQYVRVLTETGIVGFLVFIWMIAATLGVALRNFRTMEGNNFARGVIIGFIAGFMGLLAQSTTAATFIIIRIMEPFWFLVAIIVMLPELEEPPPEPEDA